MSEQWCDFRQIVEQGIKRRGISLRELCRRAGTDASYLSKVLAGKRNPPEQAAVLNGLAEALELSPEIIFLSVGRIPPLWEKLRHDRAAFNSVNVFLAGGTQLPAAGAGPAARSGRSGDEIPEELL
ncbi:MAG: helix-turn-helix transcriptional regulator [Elusimicrobiaceae bacterium]|nr:helix-turn-helix transcriptional regulator [Elusimicrobiaceae bacterium]